MPVPALLRTLELGARKLRGEGLLVAETINPFSPLALRRYYASPGGAQPLAPETFELLARRAGFVSAETRYFNQPSPSPDTSGAVADILLAPLDYALVARA
jgi:hypothetical protein